MEISPGFPDPKSLPLSQSAKLPLIRSRILTILNLHKWGPVAPISLLDYNLFTFFILSCIIADLVKRKFTIVDS